MVKDIHSEVLEKLAMGESLSVDERRYWAWLTAWQTKGQLEGLRLQAHRNKTKQVRLSVDKLQGMVDFISRRLEDVHPRHSQEDREGG